MRDKFCIKTLSFKSSLNDSNYITKTEAITNSSTWTFDDPESCGQDDPPEAEVGFFDVKDQGSSSTLPTSGAAGPSSPPPSKPADGTPEPATVTGSKRKSRSEA